MSIKILLLQKPNNCTVKTQNKVKHGVYMSEKIYISFPERKKKKNRSDTPDTV